MFAFLTPLSSSRPRSLLSFSFAETGKKSASAGLEPATVCAGDRFSATRLAIPLAPWVYRYNYGDHYDVSVTRIRSDQTLPSTRLHPVVRSLNLMGFSLPIPPANPLCLQSNMFTLLTPPVRPHSCSLSNIAFAKTARGCFSATRLTSPTAPWVSRYTYYDHQDVPVLIPLLIGLEPSAFLPTMLPWPYTYQCQRSAQAHLTSNSAGHMLPNNYILLLLLIITITGLHVLPSESPSPDQLQSSEPDPPPDDSSKPAEHGFLHSNAKTTVDSLSQTPRLQVTEPSNPPPPAAPPLNPESERSYTGIGNPAPSPIDPMKLLRLKSRHLELSPHKASSLYTNKDRRRSSSTSLNNCLNHLSTPLSSKSDRARSHSCSSPSVTTRTTFIKEAGSYSILPEQTIDLVFMKEIGSDLTEPLSQAAHPNLHSLLKGLALNQGPDSSASQKDFNLPGDKESLHIALKYRASSTPTILLHNGPLSVLNIIPKSSSVKVPSMVEVEMVNDSLLIIHPELSASSTIRVSQELSTAERDTHRCISIISFEENLQKDVSLDLFTGPFFFHGVTGP